MGFADRKKMFIVTGRFVTRLAVYVTFLGIQGRKMAYMCGSPNPPPGTCIAIPVARKHVLVDEELGVLKDETIHALKALIQTAYPDVLDEDIITTTRPGTAHELHIYDVNDEDNSKQIHIDDDFTYALVRPELVDGKPNLLEDIRNYILGPAVAAHGGRRRHRHRKTRRSSRQSRRRRSQRHRKTRRH